MHFDGKTLKFTISCCFSHCIKQPQGNLCPRNPTAEAASRRMSGRWLREAAWATYKVSAPHLLLCQAVCALWVLGESKAWMGCLVRNEMSFNWETHYFLIYDSGCAGECVGDGLLKTWSEMTECCEQPRNLGIALLPPLLPAYSSGPALLYHGIWISFWAVLFPFSISNKNSIYFFHIGASFFWQRPLYWSASMKGQQCESSLK